MFSIASADPFRQVHNSTPSSPPRSPADRLAESPKGDPSPDPRYNSAAVEALLSRIEEKQLRREFARSATGRRPGPSPKPLGGLGDGETPLVNRAISRRRSVSSLPPRFAAPSYPSTFYRVYRQDVYVCRGFPTVPPADQDGEKRGAIVGFSDKSRRRLDHICNNAGHLVKSMFSLTYHEAWPINGQETKRHLQAWLKVLRRLLPGIEYLWILEFQGRGAPHFHVWLTVPPTPEVHKKLAAAWVRITDGTDPQYWCHVHPKAWVDWEMKNGSYVVKQYAAKAQQKEVPEGYRNVGKFWDNSSGMNPKPDMVVEPSAVARFAKPTTIPWNEESLKRFFDRTLRRYHEKCMNYDRTKQARRNKRRRKSQVVAGRAELSGAFRVPFGTKILVQLMNYVAEYGPDDWAIARRHEDVVPF